MASTYYEPSPRWCHYAVSIEGKLFVWGGRPEKFSAQYKKELSAVIEIFDPCLETWEQHATTGVSPPGLYEGGCTSLGKLLITFGGCNGDFSFNSLHKLNTATLHWKEINIQNLSDGPMPKTGCCLVSFQGGKLALVGGVGTPTDPIQLGATFFDPENEDRNRCTGTKPGWTNEFHLFDTQEGVWSSPSFTGKRPPPCSWASFIRVAPHRAALIGGYLPQHGITSDDVYLFDLDSMHWSILEKSVRGPSPVGRSSHAACCINYGEDHPQVLVSGGVVFNSHRHEALSDLWLLDVDSAKWKELPLPQSPALSRESHIAVAISVCPHLVEVVMFGGSSTAGGGDQSPKMAKTTVMLFELVERLAFGLQPASREWVVVGVANWSQLGSPERIREKMIRLQQRVSAAEQEEKSLLAKVTTLNERVTAAEKRADHAEQQVKDMQQKLQASQTLISHPSRIPECHTIGCKQTTQSIKRKWRRQEVESSEESIAIEGQSTVEDRTSHSAHSSCNDEAGNPDQALETPLDEGDMFEVTDYLMDLEKTHVYHLGVVLGISQHKVKVMMDESRIFLDDVIAAWLRREDQVEKRGVPSWGTLVRALRHQRVKQNGIASKLLRKIGV